MSGRANVSVAYDVQVSIGGGTLVFLAAFGGGRSVHDLLIGGAEWGPSAELAPWLDRDSSPVSAMLGGIVRLGDEVDVEWQ